MGLALGQYIKSVRKTAKLSAAKLSNEAGISKSYLDYIESGAREPAVDVLAKLAAVLLIPLEALLDVQKKAQLESAINKLRAVHVSLSEDEIRAVARTADSSQSIDELALAKAQEAFRDSNNAAKYADYIENPDLRAIVRAGARLSGEDLEKLRKVMESLYPNEF